MDEKEIKALRDEQQKLVKQLHEENEKLIAAGKNTQKEWTEKMQVIQERLDQVETKLNRPALPGPDSKSENDEKARQRNATFLNYLRKGRENLSPEEVKVLTVADDTGGGFLATPETVNEIIKGVVEFSPVRSVARIRTTSQRSVRIRKRTGTFTAQWVAEVGSKTETTGLAYGLEDAPVHELYALVDVSEQDLEDSDFNLESELNMEFSEQFGVAEGLAFISGNAVGKPEGITVNTAIGQVNSGDANLLTADGVIKLFYALKDAYARNGSFLLKRSSIQAIRLLKDSQNQYLWQAGLAGNQPNTILGRPYLEAVDMPAVAANALAISFGDFRRGYLIIDRVVISVKRDPFTQATSGAVRFIARKRVGGQVVNAEAIKLQKVAA